MQKINSENEKKREKQVGILNIERQLLNFHEFFSNLKSIAKTNWKHHSM